MTTRSLLPSCWGSALWFSLHSIALAYEPSVQNKQDYYNFFQNLGSVLPCEECKIHYRQNFNGEELKNALETNEGLFRWVYDLHNRVNAGTGVPESMWPKYEDILKKYNNFRATGSCSDIPGVCGGSENKKKRVKVVEEFYGDIPIEKDHIIIFLVVIVVLCVGWTIMKNMPKTIKKKS